MLFIQLRVNPAPDVHPGVFPDVPCGTPVAQLIHPPAPLLLDDDVDVELPPLLLLLDDEDVELTPLLHNLYSG